MAVAIALAAQPARADGGVAATEAANQRPAPAAAIDVSAAASGHSDRGKWISLGTLAGLYTGLTVWTYFAWYHGKPQLPEFTVNGDGWFGPETYAGGADKLGHFQANLAISRWTTDILISGGWDRLRASLLASGMSLAFFTYVEIKDGFFYQLSSGDMVGNALGAALSAAMVNVPALDRAIDFRFEYVPSREYWTSAIDDGDINFVEDYSGQTYYLAFHLDSLSALSAPERLPWSRRWLGYVDLVAGFETRNYKPDPSDPDAARRQRVFLGVALNMQRLLSAVVGPDPQRGRAGRIAHGFGHRFLEVINVPYTSLRYADASRSPDAP